MLKHLKKLHDLQKENERLFAANCELKNELAIAESGRSLYKNLLEGGLKAKEEKYNSLLEDYRTLRDKYAESVAMSVLLLNRINDAAKVVAEKLEEEK